MIVQSIGRRVRKKDRKKFPGRADGRVQMGLGSRGGRGQKAEKRQVSALQSSACPCKVQFSDNPRILATQSFDSTEEAASRHHASNTSLQKRKGEKEKEKEKGALEDTTLNRSINLTINVIGSIGASLLS